MKVDIPPFSPISSLTSQAAAKPCGRQGASGSEGGFQQLLQETMKATQSTLSFSRHAQERLQDRSISLSPGEILRLERATDQAAARGAQTGLMMMGNLNLIVSVPNRMVVTAMERTGNENAIFTNIDTAVVVSEEE